MPAYCPDKNSRVLGPINVGLGLGGGLAVGSATTALGGSWLAIPMCALFGIAAGKLFAVKVPRNAFWQILVNAHCRIRNMPRPARMLFAVMLVGVVAVIDITSDTIDLPLGFYVYMFPIFLSSILFGRKAAFAATLVSLLAVAFFVIPPRYSFGFATLWDIATFGIFLILTLIVLAVTGAQADLSIVSAEKRANSIARITSPGRPNKVEGDAVDFLRAEAYYLTQVARACTDVKTAHVLEGVGVDLMEKAAELELLLKIRPSSAV